MIYQSEETQGWADPVRLRQILRNLLINAARYGGDRIEVNVRQTGDVASMAIIDDGPGIPEGDRERIFDAYQTSHLTPGRPGSLGLGLTVSRQLARLMGGNLTYHYDNRSVFELTIPARPGHSGSRELERLRLV